MKKLTDLQCSILVEMENDRGEQRSAISICSGLRKSGAIASERNHDVYDALDDLCDGVYLHRVPLYMDTYYILIFEQ